MPDSTLQITISAQDNASAALTKVGSSLKTLGTDATAAGQQASSGLSKVNTATNQASTSAGKLATAYSKLRGSGVAIGALTAEFGATLSEFARAANADSAAETVLASTINATGASWERYEAAVKQADDAGVHLGYTDAQTMGALTRIIGITGNASTAFQVLSAAQDLARGRNMSLVDAAQLVARAYEGQTDTLTRYGIAVQKGATGLTAVDAVQKRFAGDAQSYADSTAGATDRLRAEFDRFEVSAGNLFGKLTPFIALLPGIGEGGEILGAAIGRLAEVFLRDEAASEKAALAQEQLAAKQAQAAAVQAELAASTNELATAQNTAAASATSLEQATATQSTAAASLSMAQQELIATYDQLTAARVSSESAIANLTSAETEAGTAAAAEQAENQALLEAYASLQAEGSSAAEAQAALATQFGATGTAATDAGAGLSELGATAADAGSGLAGLDAAAAGTESALSGIGGAAAAADDGLATLGASAAGASDGLAGIDESAAGTVAALSGIGPAAEAAGAGIEGLEASEGIAEAAGLSLMGVLGPVGLIGAAAGLAVGIGVLAKQLGLFGGAEKSASENAQDLATNINNYLAQLSGTGMGAIAASLRPVEATFEQIAAQGNEAETKLIDLQHQLTAGSTTIAETQGMQAAEANSQAIQKQIDAIQKLVLTQPQIDSVQKTLQQLFNEPGIDAPKAAAAIEQVFAEFSSGKISGAAMVKDIQTLAAQWGQFSTSVEQAADKSKTSLGELVSGFQSAIAGIDRVLTKGAAAQPQTFLDKVIAAYKTAIAQATEAQAKLQPMAAPTGDWDKAAAVLHGVVSNEAAATAGAAMLGRALGASATTAANQLKTVVDLTGQLGEMPGLVNVVAQGGGAGAGIASTVIAAQSALSGYDAAVQVAITDTGQLLSSTQSTQQWADGLINVAGQTGKIDDLLAKGVINQTEYNAAQAAYNQLTTANLGIQHDLLKIQTDQAPLIAQQTQSLKAQYDQIAKMPAAQQEVALGWMDQTEAAKANTAVQLASNAALSGFTSEAQGAIVAAANADPVLKQMLLSMGLIKQGANGKITVSFPNGESLNADVEHLTQSIDALTKALGGTPPTYTPKVDVGAAVAHIEQLKREMASLQAAPPTPSLSVLAPAVGSAKTQPLQQPPGQVVQGTSAQEQAYTQRTQAAVQQVRLAVDNSQANAAIQQTMGLAGAFGHSTYTGKADADNAQAILGFGLATGAGVTFANTPFLGTVDANNIPALTNISAAQAAGTVYSGSAFTSTVDADGAPALGAIAGVTADALALGGLVVTPTIDGDPSGALAAVGDASGALSAINGQDAEISVGGDSSGAIGAVDDAAGSLAGINGASSTVYIGGDASGYYASVPPTGVVIGTNYIDVEFTGPAAAAKYAALGGVLGYAGGGVIAELAEVGPELLRFAGGGTALAVTRGLYNVPVGTSVTPAPATRAELAGLGGLTVQVTVQGNVFGIDDLTAAVTTQLVPALTQAFGQRRRGLGL